MHPRGEVLGLGAGDYRNVAVTDRAELMVTSHVGMRMPEQAPPHERKTCNRSGVAVSMTVLSSTNPSVQSGSQLMPAGVLVTVPAPLVDTVRVNVSVNVAVTVRAAVIVSTQLPTPEQPPPLQPEKTEL